MNYWEHGFKYTEDWKFIRDVFFIIFEVTLIFDFLTIQDWYVVNRGLFEFHYSTYDVTVDTPRGASAIRQ